MRKDKQKSERYEIRLTQSEREILERAAELSDNRFQVSDLVRDTSTLTAELVLSLQKGETTLEAALGVYGGLLAYMAGTFSASEITVKVKVNTF